MTDVTLNGIERLRSAFRELVEAEGLRPLAARTGIPVGQIRSLLDGRAVRITTIQSMTAVLGVRLTIGPGTGDPAPGPPLLEGAPTSIQRLASLSAAAFPGTGQEPTATPLREGVAIVKDLADRVATAAHSLLQLVAGWEPAANSISAGPTAIAPGEGRLVMIPFLAKMPFRDPDQDPVFQGSPDLTVGVAQEARPPWARPDRLICMRTADDSLGMTGGDGDFVALDPGQTDPVDQELFALGTQAGPVVRRLCHRDRWFVVSDEAPYEQRPLTADDRILGQVAWRGPRNRSAASRADYRTSPTGVSRIRDSGSAGA